MSNLYGFVVHIGAIQESVQGKVCAPDLDSARARVEATIKRAGWAGFAKVGPVYLPQDKSPRS